MNLSQELRTAGVIIYGMLCTATMVGFLLVTSPSCEFTSVERTFRWECSPTVVDINQMPPLSGGCQEGDFKKRVQPVFTCEDGVTLRGIPE